MKKIVNILVTVILIIGAIFIIKLMVSHNAYNEPINITVKNNDLTKDLTVEQKLEDFEYLYNTLKEKYPFFEVEKRKIGYDWLAHKEEFENWIRSTKNNTEFYNTIKKIISLLQDGHATLITPEIFEGSKNDFKNEGPWRIFYHPVVEKDYEYWKQNVKNETYILPVIFRYIEGKYVATGYTAQENTEKYGIPEGSVLLKIGELTPDEYVKALKDKTILNYDYKRDRIISYYLFVYTDDMNTNVKLTLLTPDGRTIVKDLTGVEGTKFIKENNNLKNLETAILVDNKVAYLKIRRMEISEELLNQEGKEIYEFLKKIKDYPYLVIDIRGNDGGNDLYWQRNIVEPLVKEKINYSWFLITRTRYQNSKTLDYLPKGRNYPPELTKDFGYFLEMPMTIKPKNPVGFNGKIFLLTDSGVYSAAESFASFAKATKWATLVGTPTSGGLGLNPKFFVLLNSGLIIRYPDTMVLNSDGSIDEEVGTWPDVYVEQSYEDFMNYLKNRKNIDENNILETMKYDTVLKKVLEMTR